MSGEKSIAPSDEKLAPASNFRAELSKEQETNFLDDFVSANGGIYASLKVSTGKNGVVVIVSSFSIKSRERLLSFLEKEFSGGRVWNDHFAPFSYTQVGKSV